MTTPTPFNLATCPWVGALTPAGPVTVSLTGLLRDADHLTIATGHPLGDQAVFRLTLAAVYETLGSPTSYPTRPDLQAVADHLEETSSRWSLTGPTPFMQDPTLPDQPSTNPGTPACSPVAARRLDLTYTPDRPLLSDHRRPSQERPLTPAEAALALVTYQAYPPLGVMKGCRNTPTASRTGAASLASTAVQVRPAATLADALTIAWLPVADPGRVSTSWDPAGPAGEAGHLTFLSRRLLLHTDQAGNIDTFLQHSGWVPPTHTPGTPADTLPGQRCVIINPNPSKGQEGASQKATPLIGRNEKGTGAPGAYATTGDPAALAAATQVSSPSSLIGRARAAGLDVTWLATAFQVDKGTRAGAFAVTLPDPQRAADTLEARTQALAPYTPLHPWDVDQATEGTLPLAPPTGAEQATTWPTEVRAVTRRPEREAEMEVPDFLARDAAAARAATRTTDLSTTWWALANDPEAAGRLAHLSRTRTLTGSDCSGLPLVDDSEATRLWVGLAATWHTRRHQSGRPDQGDRPAAPLPVVWARTIRNHPATLDPDTVCPALASTTRVAALRQVLSAMVDDVAEAGEGLSWRGLHADLAAWGRAVGAAWGRAARTGRLPEDDTTNTGI